MNARVTIAEVDEIVEVGALSPEEVVTPGIFVNRIVKVKEDPGFPRRIVHSLYPLLESPLGRAPNLNVCEDLHPPPHGPLQQL